MEECLRARESSEVDVERALSQATKVMKKGREEREREKTSDGLRTSNED